jgi:hypothetical protein
MCRFSIYSLNCKYVYILGIYNNMRAAKNSEIESDVYDEFLALDMTEQKEIEQDNNSDAKTTKRKLKDGISTYALSSTVVCSAILFQGII